MLPYSKHRSSRTTSGSLWIFLHFLNLTKLLNHQSFGESLTHEPCRESMHAERNETDESVTQILIELKILYLGMERLLHSLEELQSYLWGMIKCGFQKDENLYRHLKKQIGFLKFKRNVNKINEAKLMIFHKLYSSSVCTPIL